MTGDKSFIEVQFPVSKVSKESYKERMSNLGQTLVGLGKWWGRKPLVMVRSALLGLLMPASEEPIKDMEIFLKILTMDEEGLWLRKKKAIPPNKLYEASPLDKKKLFFVVSSNGNVSFIKGVTQEEKTNIQKIVFQNMGYDEKIKYCVSPEHIKDTSVLDWVSINKHLGTNARNIQELFRELGFNRFGFIPTVGDCFCGGGSVPFEAARLGLNIHASELNPIAALLTWASLNILGSTKKEIIQLKIFQEKIYSLVDDQINEWGIELNENGWRADSYLYCFETKCPECSYMVPIAPSWVIGRGTMTVAILVTDITNKCFNIEIKSNVSKEELKQAESTGTIKNDHLYCPNCNMTTPISVIRGDRKDSNGNLLHGMRKWGANDFIPQSDDVFQERLYCIRYTQKYIDERGRNRSIKHYVAPNKEDLEREQKTIVILKNRFKEWQEKGYIPNSIIEEGDKTKDPIREKGWSYWHQLFNPRQLLTHGLLLKFIDEYAVTQKEFVVGILGVNRCCNFNSRLSRWASRHSVEKVIDTFNNQALNTMYNYGNRSLFELKTTWFFNINVTNIPDDVKQIVELHDAREISNICDFYMTDPPYADAVNYHELSEFFLAWNKKLLKRAFPNWYVDSKRALAVKGKGYSFNKSMVDIYKNLSEHMPDNGIQIVMFTHQDVKVWAELSIILWAANLKVTAAWNIATETESGGLKEGNYVKGTVLLVLRKQTSDKTVFEDELYTEIEEEVKKQVDSMQALDDKEDPNFSDADYLLAAYASSLKVLTSYKTIEGMDIQYELSKDRNSSEPSPVERMIRSAVKVAYDYLIPINFDSFIWKLLSPTERFFIKGIEAEKHGSTQLSAYQELARGFGVNNYKDMLANTKANNARLKTASDYKMSGMQSDDAKVSVVRNALTAIYRGRKEENPEVGKNWLRNELEDYWGKRETLVELLDYISELEHHDHMEHWLEDARYARLIRELVRSDGY